MENLSIKSIYIRLKSETPRFWKKIRTIMITCGSIGGALVAIPAEYTIAIYQYIPGSLPGTLFTIGAVGTALASMTRMDNKTN